MRSREVQEPSIEVQRELEKSNSQLAIYAQDLRTLVIREREKSRELAAANEQLKSLAEQLQRSNKRINAILNSITDAFVAVDGSWKFTYLNEAAEALLGRSQMELLDKNIWDELSELRGSIFEQRFGRAFREATPVTFEARYPRTDKWLNVHVYPSEDGLSIYLSDVSERRQLQDQLQHAQKMEALGRLTGGVAHDFNNILAAIKGYSDLILAEMDPEDPMIPDLEGVKSAVDRGSGLVRQLMAFSRKQVLQPTVLDLNAVIAETDRMLRRLIGEDIEMVSVPAEGLWRILADPGQMVQVVINLAVNAWDAMPRGGKLVFETSNFVVEDAFARSRAGIEPGSYVLLAVSDKGCGMDTETLSHIFEPFFTTKEFGKGTGLGLSTVFGIIKQSGGHIDVRSQPGEGTTFNVYLPRVETDEAAETKRLASDTRGGTETILLVEDDEDLRWLTRRALLKKGYTVLEASSGAKAVEICEKHEGPMDLLLTDVVMPRLGGGELAERLRKVRPTIKILYMSGYVDDGNVRHGIEESGSEMLQKPFSAASLARKVREILDAPDEEMGDRV